MDGNKVLLCAGGVLVMEAVGMCRSRDLAHEFARKAIKRGSDYIREVGSSIGLDETVVDSVIVDNDRLPSCRRLNGTVQQIVRLRFVDRQ